MRTAIIADIQRASVHDGPGLRTTVFFKGCPLRCEWCHNPECISCEPEVLLYPEKCIGCGRCSEGCYTGARVLCGKEMTSDELLAEILLDKEYYGTEGGVTFSGGEALLQKAFLLEIIEKCKAEGVNTAVETSLVASVDTSAGAVTVLLSRFVGLPASFLFFFFIYQKSFAV